MIPRIDVRLCNARKEYVGTLDFEYEGDDSLIDLPDTRFSSPVRARLRYELFEDDSIELTGTLVFTIEGPCSRCLSPVKKEIAAQVNATFVAGEDDGEAYGYRGGVADLCDLLRDTVLLALPMKLVCEGDCELPVWENL